MNENESSLNEKRMLGSDAFAFRTHLSILSILLGSSIRENLLAMTRISPKFAMR